MPRNARKNASKATTDSRIDVEQALLIRGALGWPGQKLGLRCAECGQPVVPHAAGINPAHFEHVEHNPGCSRSPGTNG